jgi:hypothetical protein
VSHDLIGTDKSGTQRLGNLAEGVELFGSSYASVRNNTVAFNGKDGVSIVEGSDLHTEPVVTANRVLSNSIFANGGLGINLIPQQGVEPLPGSTPDGPTANDLGDADLGPNELQNKPVLSSAKTVSGLTTVKGKLNSHPGETYLLQFFSNPSGTNEGKKLIGQKSVTTDGSGNASFAFKPSTKVAVGSTITATATRTSTLDTSEFSSARTVASS